MPRVLVSAQARMVECARQLAPPWLTPSEQNRLDGMQTQRRRQEFVACRYALRSLLAGATGTTAEHWRLDADAGGPPRLNVQHHGMPAAAGTHLTLSHSGSHLACALATQAIGVDIEVESARSARRDTLALAALACSDHESLQLRAVDCEGARRRMFMQLWSLKEAYFKCLETGVDHGSLRRIECRRATDTPAQPLAHARSWSGQTAEGLPVVLSACTLVPSGWPAAFVGDSDIAWQGVTDWVLASCAA